jgi:hypothetical protein
MWRFLFNAIGALLLFLWGVIEHFWPQGMLQIIGFAGIPANVSRLWGAMMWPGAHVAGWVPAILGLSLIAFANWQWITDRILLRGYISLRQAARRAYEATRGSEIAEMAERPIGRDTSVTPDDILSWYCHHIRREIQIFGSRPPSLLLEEIPSKLPQVTFESGGQSLRSGRHPIVYTDLAVSKNDFRSYLANLKSRYPSRVKLN